MEEYVTKEKALAQLERCARDPYHESHYIRDAAVNTIRRMEAADVAPVRHGRWIYHMDDLYPEESTMECSVCGDFIFIRGESDNYCPNCGARMDGESDE